LAGQVDVSQWFLDLVKATQKFRERSVQSVICEHFSYTRRGRVALDLVKINKYENFMM